MAKTPLEIASLARMHTRKAVKTLAAIMNEPHAPYAARVAAAEALLDRGWGKPPIARGGDTASICFGGAAAQSVERRMGSGGAGADVTRLRRIACLIDPTPLEAPVRK